MRPCYFCGDENRYTYSREGICDYYICILCYIEIPKYIPKEQKWRYIQMLGDAK